MNNNRKWNKLLAVSAACLLLLLTLAGCGGKRADGSDDGGTMPTIDDAGSVTLPTVADGDENASGENGQNTSDAGPDETQKPTDHSGNSGNGGNSGNNGNGGNGGSGNGGSVPTPGSLG